MEKLYKPLVVMSSGLSLAAGAARAGMLFGENTATIGWFIHGLAIGIFLTASFCRFSPLTGR